MLEGLVIGEQGLVCSLLLGFNKRFIIGQLPVEHRFFRFDFLHQTGHGAVVRRDNMGQGEPVEIHQRALYFFQLGFAGHIFPYNGLRTGMHIIDTEYRKNIGQQRQQPQKNNRQDQALLQC